MLKALFLLLSRPIMKSLKKSGGNFQLSRLRHSGSLRWILRMELERKPQEKGKRRRISRTRADMSNQNGFFLSCLPCPEDRPFTVLVCEKHQEKTFRVEKSWKILRPFLLAASCLSDVFFLCVLLIFSLFLFFCCWNYKWNLKFSSYALWSKRSFYMSWNDTQFACCSLMCAVRWAGTKKSSINFVLTLPQHERILFTQKFIMILPLSFATKFNDWSTTIFPLLFLQLLLLRSSAW